jgi:photosystem II stability/assembly factor-like uncharacterized protein
MTGIRLHLTLILLLSVLLSICLTVTAQSQEYAVQVAAYHTEAEARALVRRLQADGLEAYVIKAAVHGRGIFYRVRFGRYATGDEAAQAAAAALTADQIDQFVLAEYVAPVSADAIGARPAKIAQNKIPDLSILVNRSFAVAIEWALKGNRAQRKRIVNQFPAPRELRLSMPLSAAMPEILLPVIRPDPGVAPPPIRKIRLPEATKVVTAKPGLTTDIARLPSPQLIGDSPHPPLPAEAMTPGAAEITITNPAWKIVRRSDLTGQNLRAVHFADEQRGWAAGDSGVVWRTRDGGQSWEQMAGLRGVSVNHLYFADAEAGWMIGQTRDANQNATRLQTVLLQTTDGGRTWKTQEVPGIVRVQFVNAREGWAVGDNAALLKTSDGGASWQRYEGLAELFGAPVDGANYNFGFCDVNFNDAAHGWAIGNFFGRTRTHIGGLFVTTDGGGAWRRVPLPIRLPGEIQPGAGKSGGAKIRTGRIVPGRLLTVRFTDEQNGAVTGEITEGQTSSLFVMRTRDGGRTWEQLQTSELSAVNTYFLNPTQGWASAESTLLRTEDGGATWKEDLQLRGSRIHGIFFLAPDHGWAVGDHGMILRYEARNK